MSFTCSNKSEHRITKETVVDFYKVYNEREDFNRFLEFYADSIVFEDIINGDRINGKQSLQVFFDWNNPNFIKIGSNTLIITEQIISNHQAVIKGYFTAFKWKETTFEAMHFTTILTFNHIGKITKQVDWINYPSSLVDYSNRKNANEWIKNTN